MPGAADSVEPPKEPKASGQMFYNDGVSRGQGDKRKERAQIEDVEVRARDPGRVLGTLLGSQATRACPVPGNPKPTPAPLCQALQPPSYQAPNNKTNTIESSLCCPAAVRVLR